MAGSAAPSMPVTPPPPPAGMGRAGAPATMPPAPAMPMTPPATPPGPDDGDPNAPVIAIPNLACGPGRLLGTGSVNVMIGGRGVHVAYPCNKHKGAPATFILNLHGTMPTEDVKLYQVGYFSAHNLVTSHNFITVAPKAIGSQWGNSDMGKDEPHLMEVIQWTYDTFKDFDIRAMWVGGHSWGAAYTARFGCKAELADKVKGLILMSGGGAATCQSKIAQIITTAEGDGRMPPDQTTVATSHGCMAAKSEMILMNNYTSWPGCMPGYAHANYYMLGKEHATFMDAEVVKSIGDWIKASRL
ncbi:MAG TPA: alpha/beta hydrolase, partial [Polyangiales bacterium]|nr:alpha/beta hydrolase [Polyangiales bacterium]